MLGTQIFKIQSQLLKDESPKITQEYKDVKTNKNITAIHPPTTSITIQDKYLTIPLAAPNTGSLKEELTKDIIYQNNYSNEILSTISQQLNRIESNQNKEIIIKNTSLSNQINKHGSNPLFIPQQIDENASLGYSPKLDKELGEKLSGLKINIINQNSDSSSDDEELSKFKISQIQEQFINNTNEVDRLKFRGNTTPTSRTIIQDRHFQMFNMKKENMHSIVVSMMEPRYMNEIQMVFQNIKY